jgi:hypothetical protein
MYLVDLGLGNERLFRSSQELAEAIRLGVVGEQCRIYHRARATWLPITVHPAFRRLASERLRPPSVAAGRRQWTFMPAEEAEPVSPPGPPAPAPQEILVTPPAARSWRKSLGSAFRFWDKERH